MDEFITLSKKIEFSASHRYWNDSWSEEENLKHFGKCTSKYGHGHKYLQLKANLEICSKTV